MFVVKNRQTERQALKLKEKGEKEEYRDKEI
jgi:hypothetical protein